MQQTPTPDTSSTGRKWWLIPTVLVALVVLCVAAYRTSTPSGTARGAGSDEPKSEPTSSALPVEVVKPTKGTLERKTAQAGTAMAFKWIDIYAEVSGYLKERRVDIGSVVQKGDILAVIEVPELKAQVEQQEAAVELAKAQVKQREAAVESARADQEAWVARINAAQARVRSDEANLKFRDKQRERYAALFRERSIDARMVDEQEDRYEAAFEAVNTSKEAVTASKAQEKAARAKIKQAEADLDEMKQTVKVRQAELDRARAMMDFATIRAKFSGVITYRNPDFDEGTFVRIGTSSGNANPLLTLQHTQTMRIVVPIPDRDVPFCKTGEANTKGVSTALVSFDALSKKAFPPYPVSRMAQSEDLQTKTMRAEIDVPNPDGAIKQGMYGLVTISLAKVENALSIPSACLTGKAAGGKATVYIVRDNKLFLASIRTGMDNGVDVEVVDGLNPEDDVVLNPSDDLAEGLAVTMIKPSAAKVSSSR
jgi:RND family efflux transporter MFP subunit